MNRVPGLYPGSLRVRLYAAGVPVSSGVSYLRTLRPTLSSKFVIK